MSVVFFSLGVSDRRRKKKRIHFGGVGLAPGGVEPQYIRHGYVGLAVGLTTHAKIWCYADHPGMRVSLFAARFPPRVSFYYWATGPHTQVGCVRK